MPSTANRAELAVGELKTGVNLGSTTWSIGTGLALSVDRETNRDGSAIQIVFIAAVAGFRTLPIAELTTDSFICAPADGGTEVRLTLGGLLAGTTDLTARLAGIRRI